MSKIKIDPKKKGTFKAAATKAGKSVQAYADQVLNNPENYTTKMVKKANFAKNAAKWDKKEHGGKIEGGCGCHDKPKVKLMSGCGCGKGIMYKIKIV